MAARLARVVASHTSPTGVLTITMQNGRRRNPLSTSTMRELAQALRAGAASDVTRAVLLRAEGPAFSSGHDLKEMQAAAALADELERTRAAAAIFEQCEDLMHAVRTMPVPVIAAVEGAAHAAGCQLVAECDIVVADRLHASFATPGVKIGLFCHTPAVSVVSALGGGSAGARRAARMLYTGEAISAEEAERMGLVHELAPEGMAANAASKIAETIAAASTRVVREGKKVLCMSSGAESYEEAMAVAGAAMVRGVQAADAAEGIGAFLAKRPPRFP